MAFREIILSTGETSLVDESDYDFLMKWKWYLSNGYAITGEGRKKMHRLILNPKDGEIIDHIDRNKLNNTRQNLRIVSKEENIHNQKKRTNTFNNYKGTYWVERLGLWASRCRVFNNDYFLGYYKTEIAAAYAYNKKAISLSNCCCLNEFDLPKEILDKMLIDDLRKIETAEKVSKYDGVYWHKKSGRMKCGKWEAKVRVDGKYKSLGRFIDEEDANAAIILFTFKNKNN